MKKIIIAVIFLICNYGFSQSCTFHLRSNNEINKISFCSVTSCDDSLIIYKNYPISNIDTKSLKIRWTIFEDDDGSNSLNDSLVHRYMQVLNDTYSSYKFNFELFSIEHHKNSIINHAERNAWEDSISFYEPYVKYSDDIINVLVTKEFGSWDDQGFATFPFDIPEFDYATFPERRGVIVINQKLLDSEFEGFLSIIPHEFGHLFGLFHVDFNNSDCGALCNESVSPENNEIGIIPYNSGDFIRDTHPMAKRSELSDLEMYCDNQIDTILLDECTGLELFNQFPNMTNYMSLFINCHDHFTEEQTLRMHCFVETYYPRYINNQLTKVSDITMSDDILLLPNPAQDKIKIFSRNNFETRRFKIYSQNGHLIKSFKNYKGDEIKISHLRKGLYFILLQSESSNQNQIIKFIKA